MGSRVAVLMGGRSAEREVSLGTGRAIAGALRELGHTVVEVDAQADMPAILARERPDAAFLALHGRGGEDGTVQGLLEIMRIPYTGCGVLSSALTMDKVMTKHLLSYHGVPLARDLVARSDQPLLEVVDRVRVELGFPVMVKAANEGSSIGVYEVRSEEEMEGALESVFAMDTRALVEEFVDGRLLTVGIVGAPPVALPVLEIITHEGFYDYEHKYLPGKTEYEVPARLPEDAYVRAGELSMQSFEALLCEGISRVDLILESDTDRMVVLEVNTIPGMTETSLLPKAAAAMGMGFEELVAVVLAGARLKTELAG